METNDTSKLQETAVEESVENVATVETAADFIDYLKNLIDSENPNKEKVEAIKTAFYKHQKQEIELARKMFAEAGNPVEEFNMEPYNALETEFKSIMNLWREKRAEQLSLLEKERQDNLDKKNRIIDAIHALNEDTEDIHKSLSEVRRLQQEWKETGAVAQEHVNTLWKRYQTEVENFYDQLRLYNEFRDYDSKKNLELQTALCEAAEKLNEEGDVVVAFRKLQELHEQWREIGPVAKEVREEIWQRFKNASTEINKKYQQFFERLKDLENENLTQKTEICEKLEAIDVSTLDTFKAWEKMTNEVIELQERWKTIGFAPKKLNTKVFERYRAACDKFFEAKSLFYKGMKEKLNENLEKKRALCEKAEALKDSTAWSATANQLIQIQKEWKTIGQVPRKASDALWKRFISACDYFFEQKEKNTSSQREEEQQHLQAKLSLIEEVNNYQETPEPEEAPRVVKDFTARWNEIGHVPFKEKDKVYAKWREAIEQLMVRLNVDKTSRRLSSFQSNLDEIRSKGAGKVGHERERLMRQYESICNEIKTCENNIGFFTMSSKSTGSNLLKEMNRNIEKLKEERDILFKKIQMIDEA
ncbi:MAG: DUF349 domain-containing protein [Bacteroidales bacterium]|nr:DUF349 domain-containing protein [Bacteroidales bacterium]